ncbi:MULTISPECIES: replicative DNA helicase [unclassified Lacticaseibacillus]|uniref:replicative DNA helicase n=1 Tax=unclassified Lacticaseibacillus TaxID=2759744 RepID=UPI0019427CA3|nr:MULTISPECIES: replicative DNA helicase [unclassified Lacticaseibacillus]
MDNQIRNMPPQDTDAEKALLGGIFLSPSSLATAEEFLVPEAFYKRANQLVFAAMSDLSLNEEGIDVVTVKNYLDDHNQLDDVGGVPYLMELSDAVPTPDNVVYYAKIIADKAQLRQLIDAATKIIQQSYDDPHDVQALMENAESAIMKVNDGNQQGGFRPIKDVLNLTMNEIDKLAQGDQTITGLPTGFKALDEITTGLHDDELIILAARPAVGKTAFALNIAQNVGTKTPKTVAMFSLEMGAESLVNRMLCAEGNINSQHLRTGQLTPDDWNSLVVAMGSLSNASIFIDDTPGMRVAQIRSECLKLQKEMKEKKTTDKNGNQEKGAHPLGLVVIDYLQLIEGTGENRQQEVSAISRQLKKLAKELHCPVIALSQLSRGVEQRQDKRPVLSDIRESGSIEQDADIVAFLYREDYYRDGEGGDDDDADNTNNNAQGNGDEPDVGPIEVIIEKNRSGARGTVKLLFVKSYNKFSSLAPMQE